MDGITPPKPEAKKATQKQPIKGVVAHAPTAAKTPKKHKFSYKIKLPRIANSYLWRKIISLTKALGSKLPVKNLKQRCKKQLAAAIKFYYKHRLPSRIAAGFLALLIVFSTGYEIYSYYFNTTKYHLSSSAEQLLPAANATYAQKLTYDTPNKQYAYNTDYKGNSSEVAGQVSGPRFTATFPTDPKKASQVTDAINEVSVTFTPKFDMSNPTKQDNRLIYPISGMPAAKVYTVRAASVKEDIVIEKYIQKELSFTYELGLPDGTEARSEADGSIGIYGADSAIIGNVTTGSDKDAELLQKARQNAKKTKLLFTIPVPSIIEPGKKPSDAKVKYELNGKTLTIKSENLDKATYPLSIDPTVYIESAAQLMRGNNETNVDFDVANELIQKSQTTGARIDAWSSTTNLSNAVWGQGTAVAGGYIYSVGGVGSGTTNTSTYNTAGSSNYVVPAGVTKITVKAWGAGGGGGAGNGKSGSGGAGGGGGFAQAVLNVTPGNTLTVTVGSGGSKASGNSNGGNGGGFSAVQLSGTYLVQAGGGGGGGGSRGRSSGDGGAGGAGGGTSGVGGTNGEGTNAGGGGGPGTASAGTAGTAGAGGTAGSVGAANAGGNGAGYASSTCNTAVTNTQGANGGFGGGGGGGRDTTSCANGGGGGGGRYGGGGGGSNASNNNRGGGGGGGGSSYINPTYLVSGTDQQVQGSGQNPGSNADSDRGGLGDGGSGARTSGSATAGDNGIVVISYTLPGSVTDAVYWAKFNTSTNAIESPNPGTGACSGWCTNASYNLPTALTGLSLVAYNGYLYAIGGENSGGTPQTTVYIAKIGANGEPQLWHPTGGTPDYWYQDTSLSAARSKFAAVAYNNKLYILGGLTTSSTVLSTNTVQSASINPTGTLSTWTTTGMQALSGSSGGNRYGLTAHVYNDTLYAIGGDATFSGSPVANVDYSKLNSDGTMNSWVQTTSLGSGRLTLGGVFSTIFGGYVYVAGGCSVVNASGYCTSITSDVQLASINADGSLAEFNTILGLTNDRFAHTLIAWQGGLYRLGGCRAQDLGSGGCTDTALDVTYGVINPDGEASTVATSSPSGTAPCSGSNPYNCDLPGVSIIGNVLGGSAILNGYLYIWGGCSNTTSGCGTVSRGVIYTSIGSDGSLTKPKSCGSWTAVDAYCYNTTSLATNGVAAPGVAVFDGYIYSVGGFTASGMVGNIYYTAPSPVDGSISSWSTTGLTGIGATSVSYPYSFARANPSNAGSVPGNLYILGGCTNATGVGCPSAANGYTDVVVKCNLSTAGVPSACTTTGQMQIGTVPGASSAGLGAMAGTVYANYIYLMGGLTNGLTDLQTTRYAKIDDNNNIVNVNTGTTTGGWIESPNLTYYGRRRGSGFGYNGYLYVVGGYDGSSGGGGVLADIEFAKINVTDGSIGAWRVSSVNIDQRWGLNVRVSNSYAYVIGGCINGAAPTCASGGQTDSIQTFQIYNNESGALQKVTSMSDDTFATDTDRWGANAIVLNGYLYVAGGCTSATDCTTATANVQYAPISTVDGSIGTWVSTTAALPAVRAWGKLVTAGGYLYYLGGQVSAGTAQSTVYYAQPSAGNITSWATASGGIGDTASQAAQPRTKFGVAVWDNRIYVVGGLDGSAADTSTVYISPQLNSGGNIAADSWRSASNVPDVARFGGTLISYANNLYYFGGNDGTNYLSDGQFASLGYRTGTISQSGTTVTGSGTTFDSGMVGSTIQYPDGGKATVTAYTNTTTITVDASKTVPAGTTYIIQDGSVGNWTFTTSLPDALSQSDGFAANGYIYLVGGRSASASCLPKVLVAPISANTIFDTSDGIANDNLPTGVGDWSETNVRYAGGRYGAAVAYDKGKMYITGGGCTSPQAGTYSTGNITNQTGNTVTGSGTTWTNNYIGGTITYQDASTATIVGVTDATHLVVSVSKTISTTQTYSISVPRHSYSVLKSQPQVAKYSRMIDTDTDVFPTGWLMNGIDNSVGARWQMSYSSMHDTNSTTDTVNGVLQQNPNEDCGTSLTMPVMTTWGQVTNFGNVTLGKVEGYTPKNSGGSNINCARYYYFSISIDASQTFGYPEDVNRGPTLTDISLFFTADPSKRLRHGKTFTSGELQPLDTPCHQDGSPQKANCVP